MRKVFILTILLLNVAFSMAQTVPAQCTRVLTQSETDIIDAAIAKGTINGHPHVCQLFNPDQNMNCLSLIIRNYFKSKGEEVGKCTVENDGESHDAGPNNWRIDDQIITISDF